MTKQTMIKNYRQFSAADAYMLGFEHKKMLYVAVIDEIPPRMMKVEYTSSKKGRKTKLQLRLHAADKACLMRKGARCVCPMADLPLARCNNNKGEALECAISESNGIRYRGKDSVGFWFDGDLTIDGVKYQIKMNGAQIVVENTLETLKEFKKLGLTPPKQFTRNTKKYLQSVKAGK